MPTRRFEHVVDAVMGDMMFVVVVIASKCISRHRRRFVVSGKKLKATIECLVSKKKVDIKKHT